MFQVAMENVMIGLVLKRVGRGIGAPYRAA